MARRHVYWLIASMSLLALGPGNRALAAPGLEGDFNEDGIVNLRDYTIWRNNLGMSEVFLNGNGNGSGTVDAGDYRIWKERYGESTPGALTSHTIPEPGTVVLATLGAGLAGWQLRRRGRA